MDKPFYDVKLTKEEMDIIFNYRKDREKQNVIAVSNEVKDAICKIINSSCNLAVHNKRIDIEWVKKEINTQLMQYDDALISYKQLLEFKDE